MPKLNVYDISGKELENITLDEKVFGLKDPNVAVITDAVLNELANKRRGTAKAKTRAEVSGGGKKPWNQKGTGRARHGSNREPQWRHGGIAHGPKPRRYAYRLPDKVKKLAYRLIISDKIGGGNLLVINEIKFDKPKVKTAIETLINLKISENSVLIITVKRDENVSKSVANLVGVKLLAVENINCHDLMKFDKVVFTKEALSILEKRL